MKYLLFVIIMFLSNMSFAGVVCKQGVVSNGASLSEFKKKCSMEYSIQDGVAIFKNKNAKKDIVAVYDAVKIKLENGEKYTVLFLDDQLVAVID
jgi:hypothetical protein